MNTRMELWKTYRENIEKNISLQNSVMFSNEKLKILHNRLLKVFPKYDEKYPSNLSKFSANIKEIEQVPDMSNAKIEKIIKEIIRIENPNDPSFNSIDKINFSSEDLEKVVDELKKGKINKIKYIDTYESEELIMNQTQEIILGVKMNKNRIAIDGPSGSGKSTVAKIIGKKLGLKYINTGLVYRAIALKIHKDNIDINDEESVVKHLVNIKINLLKDEVVNLNGEEVTSQLRTDEISQGASKVASYLKVREFAVKIQIDEASNEGVIMDGRDTTFKIMPNADFKFFLDTIPEIRAQRRVKQNKEIGFSTDYDKILSEIKERDHRDRTRMADPLHKTLDAHLIDASNMTIDDVVNEIINIIKKT